MGKRLETWDNTCPECGGKLEVYDAFIDHDYSTDFTMGCSGCGSKLDVIVQSVPEFGVSLAEDERKA